MSRQEAEHAERIAAGGTNLLSWIKISVPFLFPTLCQVRYDEWEWVRSLLKAQR